MLSGFDWLRRSRSGAELLATLQYLEAKSHPAAGRPSASFVYARAAGAGGTGGISVVGEEIGPPHSALDGPCQRCWVYPRVPSSRRDLPPDGFYDRRTAPYCQSCRSIVAGASRLGHVSRQSIVIWGRVNRLLKQLESGEGFRGSHILGTYVHDENHFLLAMRRHELKHWLQEVVLYHGTSLKGLIQILPTTGTGRGIGMGDILCWAVHQEGRFALDRLRVRFFSAPHQLLVPHTRDRRGMLTFEISDFLSLLEMAAVFRTILLPEAQQVLHDLLSLTDASEEQFYWGRFMGYLTPEAKDMLSAWRIRQWPKYRVQLLYELLDYVAFYQTD